MPGPAEPDLPLKRSFALPAEAADAALGAVERAATRPPRDLWLRVAIFAMTLGALVTLLYAWFLAGPAQNFTVSTVDLASFQRVLMPILAITAVIGVLVLERAAVLGVVLMLLGTVVALAGGAVWLIPGTILGCVWAAHHQGTARATLGFLMLVPGVAAVYFGLVAGIGFALGAPVHGLPPALAQPYTLAQALAPLEFLPLALLGAWLLVRPLRAREK